MVLSPFRLFNRFQKKKKGKEIGVTQRGESEEFRVQRSAIFQIFLPRIQLQIQLHFNLT